MQLQRLLVGLGLSSLVWMTAVPRQSLQFGSAYPSFWRTIFGLLTTSDRSTQPGRTLGRVSWVLASESLFVNKGESSKGIGFVVGRVSILWIRYELSLCDTPSSSFLKFANLSPAQTNYLIYFWDESP